MRRFSTLVLLMVVLYLSGARSSPFAYGFYEDVMDINSPFIGQAVDGMPTAPNLTLSSDRGVNKPTANLYTSIGVSLPNSRTLVISSIDTGIAIIFCSPDDQFSDPNAHPMTIQDFDYIYWDAEVFAYDNVTTFPQDINNQIVSMARTTTTTETGELIAAVLYNSKEAIFRLLLMSGYTGMAKVLYPQPGVISGRPAVVAYPSRGPNNYIFAYAYQISTYDWSLLVQTAGDSLTFINSTEYQIYSSQKPIDIEMTYVANDVVVITYQLINATHASIRQVVINLYGQQILAENEVTAVARTSDTYTFATNVLPTGKLITLWSISVDTTKFNGLIVDYATETNPQVLFSIPAVDSTQNIGRLIVAPFSTDSFAITQSYINPTYASFTNYYTLSNCDDESGVMSLIECSQTNYACLCGCNNKGGWYEASDSISCITNCGDSIVAGNETCDNPSDPNCISCACVQNTVWSPKDLRCLDQGLVVPTTDNTTAPATNMTPGSGWSNDYIAAIILCPIGAGAAIFLGVFFGKKKQKSGQKKSKDQSDGDQQPQGLLNDKEPVSSMASDMTYSQIGGASGGYGAIPKMEIEMQQPSSDVVIRNNSKVSQAADKLNVPYAELKFITEIGAGAYGKVFIGEWQRVKVALKINTSATGADFEREAKLMVELRPHPNVVQMLGVSSDGPYPVMILEYCDGGSLDSKLFDTSREWTVADQLRTVTGIAKGLYHLHRNQIVHRDISARNILLSFGQPKISDFGLSRFVDDTKKGSTTKSNIGPIRWMAPESLKYQSYSTKSDVWTFGLVIYEIVARQEPHADADQIAIGVQIRDQGATPAIPEGCDPCLKEIMQKCWQLDPESRPSMEEICDILDNYLETKQL